MHMPQLTRLFAFLALLVSISTVSVSASLPATAVSISPPRSPISPNKPSLKEETAPLIASNLPLPTPPNLESEMSVEKKAGLPDSLKLIIGAGGIYAAFLYYGSLQEDVFRYVAADGSTFKHAWFLQVLEALANVVIGFIGMQLTGPTKGIPLRMFGISGAAQVTAKACTSLALANGLSFPVATLAKSGKMAPVMAGSLLLGGASYDIREYLQVAAIMAGTGIVSMGKKKGGESSSSLMGVVYIVLSLVLDGVTAGFQKRLKVETAKVGVKPKPYDFMFWTNLFMCLTADIDNLC
jgi:UDP-galactose transporter B1